MTISIVHYKKHSYDIYIGRGSKWGNPFPISATRTREQVVNDYREWIIKQPKLMNSLYELYNKRLACWCKQTPDDNILCHGDVLKELVEKYVYFLAGSEHLGIGQFLFCEICCKPLAKFDPSGKMICSEGHLQQ